MSFLRKPPPVITQALDEEAVLGFVADLTALRDVEQEWSQMANKCLVNAKNENDPFQMEKWLDLAERWRREADSDGREAPHLAHGTPEMLEAVRRVYGRKEDERLCLTCADGNCRHGGKCVACDCIAGA